jgi:hypothetical protein
MTKLILMAAMLGGCLLGTSSAFAQASSDNYDNGGIGGDAGHVARTFLSTTTCTCTDCGWIYNYYGSCNDQDPCTRDTFKGRGTTNTTNCCVNRNILCDAKGNLLPKAELERVITEDDTRMAAEDEQLRSTFEPGFVATYWGYEDATNRSPNAGRANSIHARIDVCLGNTDVDTVTASGWTYSGESNCETYCGSGTYNEYCNANSAAVCKDRCACLYKYNNVNLTSLTCNNL